MNTFSESELKFRKEIQLKIKESLDFVEILKQKKPHSVLEKDTGCLFEIQTVVSFFNHFTENHYSFKYDQVAEKIHNGTDAYFFINSQHPKPTFSTFQNAPNQELSFLLNYALYEYNVKYDSFSFFHIKLDQITNKTFNRESEHDHLIQKSEESVVFVRDLCLKQQYILHYLSHLETSKIRLRGDSCVAHINGVSFQLAWYFSLNRLVFTLSFAVNNIFYNDFEVDSMSEFVDILEPEIQKNNFKTLFSKEQSYFLYQYLSCHNHSIHLNEFLRFQFFVQKKTSIPAEEQEKSFICSFDDLISTTFYLDGHEFRISPPSISDDDPSRFFFSNGTSVQIFS